jgi:glutamyl-tRNA synthetase
LHVGSVRTALFNWLHARHTGGTFIFRIEDTDATRATDESMQSMMDAMHWIGLDWDEGVGVDGPHGPYRQSERSALHAAVARRLLDAGHLYADDRTAEEMETWREHRRAHGQPPVVKRSTTPDPTDGRPATLRLALPEEGSITVTDLVRGDITWEWANESDPVLQRSDGSATYPLANTADDVAQGVTLVCRGEDLLSVTPRQVFLYDLLTRDGLIDDALAEVGFPSRDPDWAAPSQFAHLSMIVGQDRKKLSKRHGSVAIQEFARQGFLQETLLNYIALLGWSPRDGRERMERDEIIAAFTLDQVGKSAAAFDVDKLTNFNGDRIRELSATALADRLVPYLDGTYMPVADDGDPDPTFTPLLASPPTAEQRRILEGLVPLVQERMQTLAEVQRYAGAFFLDDIEIEKESAEKVFRKAGAVEAITGAQEVLGDLDDWTIDAIEHALRALSETLDMGFGKVAQPIRVAVTGSSVSPPLFESIELLARETVLRRLEAALPVAMSHQP